MSLQYYHNWNLTMIRAQCIHPTRWRPLPSNVCGSSLFALPLHQTCANKMQRSSWTICGCCLDKAPHVQTMYYIRIPQKLLSEFRTPRCCTKLPAYRTQNMNTQADKAHLLTSSNFSALQVPLVQRLQNPSHGH